MTTCTAWGMYPQIECRHFKFDKEAPLKQIIGEQSSLIPYGNGRSYGDSALGENIVDVRQKDYFINFDEKTGLLHVQAGYCSRRYSKPLCQEAGSSKSRPGPSLSP